MRNNICNNIIRNITKTNRVKVFYHDGILEFRNKEDRAFVQQLHYVTSKSAFAKLDGFFTNFIPVLLIKKAPSKLGAFEVLKDLRAVVISFFLRVMKYVMVVMERHYRERWDLTL